MQRNSSWNIWGSIAKIAGMLTLVISATTALTVLGASTAAAETMVCTGTRSITFTPGVDFTETSTELTTEQTFTLCTGQSPIVSGTVPTSVSTFNVSCTSLLNGGTDSQVITWNTGETSTFTYSYNSENVAGAIVTTRTGSISSGKFAGSAAVGVSIMTAESPYLLACLSPSGLQSVSGPMSLVLTL